MAKGRSFKRNSDSVPSALKSRDRKPALKIENMAGLDKRSGMLCQLRAASSTVSPPPPMYMKNITLTALFALVAFILADSLTILRWKPWTATNVIEMIFVFVLAWGSLALAGSYGRAYFDE